jgi:hypothetical protein
MWPVAASLVKSQRSLADFGEAIPLSRPAADQRFSQRPAQLR